MKGWWESNINVWFQPRNVTMWPCYFQNSIIMFCLTISTFMYLWAIYIFPWSVCLFCCSQIVRPILAIYKSLTDTVHECRNCEQGHSFIYGNTKIGYSVQCAIRYGSVLPYQSIENKFVSIQKYKIHHFLFKKKNRFFIDNDENKLFWMHRSLPALFCGAAGSLLFSSNFFIWWAMTYLWLVVLYDRWPRERWPATWSTRRMLSSIKERCAAFWKGGWTCYLCAAFWKSGWTCYHWRIFKPMRIHGFPWHISPAKYFKGTVTVRILFCHNLGS